MKYRRQSGTFQFEEDPFSKNVQDISKIYHEVLLLLKFLQAKPQVKKMINNYYEFCYTVIKNRDDKVSVDDESDSLNYDNYVIPIFHTGITTRERNNFNVDKNEISNESFQQFYPI